jgi:hypothetical protein
VVAAEGLRLFSDAVLGVTWSQRRCQSGASSIARAVRSSLVAPQTVGANWPRQKVARSKTAMWEDPTQIYCLSWKVAGLNLNEVTGSSNLPNSSSQNIVLGFTQPLTEKSSKNILGGKAQLEHKAEPIVYVSKPYRPPQPAIVIALLLLM